jgi:hypothetical protein
MKLATRLTTDHYFLSATNPLATADQRDIEALAIRLLEAPAVLQGRKLAEHRWRSFVGDTPDAEAWDRFRTFIDECVFANLLKAVNGDPNHPRLVRLVMPPHEWFGTQVPGSRFGGGPGIDQSYAIVPIDYGGRFELNGRWIEPAPADHVYTLCGNPSFTNVLGHLELSQIEAGKDGSFTITVDPDPADGRANHIQTKPGAQYLFIRDCRSDWRQAATAIRVRRLDPPTRPPWTETQIAERAAQLLLEDGPAMYVWRRYFETLEPDTLTEPFATGSLGGLVSQMVSFAHVRLADDEAFVFTVDPAGAIFHDVQLNDFWFNAVGDYVSQTSALNNQQSARSADGTITYVLSIRDPGLHNWLDPAGLHEILLVHRWQRLPMTEGVPRPAVSSAMVKFDRLPEVLGASVPRANAAERESQLAERRATFRLRVADH